MVINDLEQLCKVVTYQGFNEILEKHDALEKALNGAKTWNDLDYDDLDFIETVMDMEKMFNIAIGDEFADKLQNTDFIDFYSKIDVRKIRNDKLNQLGI
jgi:acyl carrier protein